MGHARKSEGGLGSRLWTLFVTIVSISATANSGYAILSVMKDEFVRKRAWFSDDQMADYIAIVQSTPGAMAVNASMIVGYQVAGFLGWPIPFLAIGCVVAGVVKAILVSRGAER